MESVSQSVSQSVIMTNGNVMLVTKVNCPGLPSIMAWRHMQGVDIKHHAF